MPTQPPAEATFGVSPTEQKTSRLRAGIIGMGFIGEVHARAVRAAGGTIAALADVAPERAAQGAQRLQAGWAAPSAEALLASDEVDVVRICTPNHLHDRLARQAIEAGKHVICEKPLATTRGAAEELVAHAQSAGVVAAVPFIDRYYPTVREARDRIHTARVGRSGSSTAPPSETGFRGWRTRTGASTRVSAVPPGPLPTSGSTGA